MTNAQEQHALSLAVTPEHLRGEEIAYTTLILPLQDTEPLPLKDARAYAYLDLERAGEPTQRIAITGTCVIVGRVDPKRGTMPEIDLTSLDSLSLVSRQHARIRFEDGSFSIEDLKSLNKTCLGESVLAPFHPTPLQHGDVVRFGLVRMVFRIPGN